MSIFKKVIIILSCILCVFPTNIHAIRIVSISPVMTEIIYALGAGSELVANTKWCVYPPQAKTLPKVGDENLNFEAIIAAKPELVLGIGNKDSDQKTLKKLSIDTLVFRSPQTIKDIYILIQSVGIKIDKRQEATFLISKLQAEINAFPKPKAKRPKVMVVFWTSPLIVAGKSNFIHDMIEKAGGINAGETYYREFPAISAESIIEKNPDIIIIPHLSLLPKLEKEPFWPLVEATRHRRIYVVNEDLLSRAGPRFTEGISAIRTLINQDENK